MSNINKAILKVAQTNPEFAKAIVAELKHSAKKFKKGDFVYIKSTNAIAEVLNVIDARGTQEVRTDADGMRDASDLEPLKTSHFKPGVHFAPSTLKAMGGKLKF